MRQDAVIWSEPYNDASGTGMVTSAAKPVYEKETGEFVGVVSGAIGREGWVREAGSQESGGRGPGGEGIVIVV